MQLMPEYKKDSANTKLIEKFEEHWEKMDCFWATHHEKHKYDMQFTWMKDQWDKTAKEERRSSGRSGTETPLPPRPTLVFDISSPLIIKTINGIMKMRPALKVNAADSDSDVELAKIRAGQIKYIERNTGAVDARMSAVKQQTTAGYGFYRFDTEFENPQSFNHDVKYREIPDGTTVLFDEQSTKLNGSDNMKTIFNKEISDNEFKKLTGKDWKDWSETNDLNAVGDETKRTCWGTHESPSINEWWYVEEKPETLVQITLEDVVPPELAPEQQSEWLQANVPEEIGKRDGEGMFLKDLKKAVEGTPFEHEDFMDTDDEGEYITRKSQSRQVHRCKLVGKKIIEHISWPGYWIPVFRVLGHVTRSDGKVHMEGMSRAIQSWQKAYNYVKNNKLERIALSPKQSIIYDTDSVSKKNKKKLDTANVRNWPSIGVKGMTADGKSHFQPYRMQGVDVDAGLVVEEESLGAGMNAALGLYGAYTGDTKNEKSGRAIQAGAAESADVTFNFPNNLGRTMDFEGKVLNDLIPKVYDKARQVRMIGEDDEEQVIWINKLTQDREGNEVTYDMNQGKFDVTYTMQPSAETKRIEQREEMEALFGGAPELREILADEFIKTHDWEGADKLAVRIKSFIKMKYPDLKLDDDEKAGPSPEEQQMNQVIHELTAQVQQLMEENQAMKVDKSNETQKIENEDLSAEEQNANTEYDNETKRMKVVSEAKAKEKELRFKMDEAERKHELELKKLDNQLQDNLNNQKSEENRAGTQTHFDGLKDGLNGEITSLRQEFSGQMAELAKVIASNPVNVKIDNIIPKKQNSTVKKNTDGTIDIKHEDADDTESR
jgi:hypothetical protein